MSITKALRAAAEQTSDPNGRDRLLHAARLHDAAPTVGSAFAAAYAAYIAAPEIFPLAAKAFADANAAQAGK